METRVRVAALILHEDHVLLVSATSRPDHLIPPGGRLEAGETLVEAVEREVCEEAGVVVEGRELVAYGEVISAGRTHLELYFAAHLGQTVPFEACVSEENRQVRWVLLSDLPATPHFPERLGELCERARRRSSGPLYLGCRAAPQ